MRLTARFNGKCAKCGKPLPKDTEIEYVNKKAYCVPCVPTGDTSYEDPYPSTSEAPESIAARLGFRTHDPLTVFPWSTFKTTQEDQPCLPL